MLNVFVVPRNLKTQLLHVSVPILLTHWETAQSSFFAHWTALLHWDVFVYLPHFTGTLIHPPKVALLIALQVISRAPPCCFLSDRACRCGWDLTSIGFLMTVLFVPWVPARNADVWQEIAVEEDWASCWAGLLSRCPVRYALLIHSPFPLSPSLHSLIALFEHGME